MLNDYLNLELLNVSLSYPFLFLIAVAIILLFCSSFYKLHRNFFIGISALSLIVSFFLVLYNLNEQGFKNAFLGTLNNDILSFIASLVILLFSFLYLLMEKEENQGEFYALFLFMIASLILMVSSSNLVLIFIGLEASSLALYTLIAMRGTRNSISAAIKYFSVAAVGSGFFVLACALIYIKTGGLELNFDKISNLQNTEPDILLLSAGVLIFVLCAIKLSLAPFHFWLRDVYYATHSNLVAFISVVPKIAMFVVVMRIFSILIASGFENIAMVLAIFSMLAGALAFLTQKDVKKMFAYSSVVNASFVLASMIPLLDSKVMYSELYDFFVVFWYWILFAFSNYGVFLILSTYKNTNFESLKGLLAKKPAVAISLAICVLSLAGIPPFGVFWGKFFVLYSVIVEDYWYLAILVALSSVIMLYGYLKVIIYAFFIKGEGEHNLRLNFKQSFILTLCVCVSIFAILLML